jgi:hypothetical protein
VRAKAEQQIRLNYSIVGEPWTCTNNQESNTTMSHVRLYLVTLLHAVFGPAPSFHLVSFNTLEQFLAPIINESVVICVRVRVRMRADDQSL